MKTIKLSIALLPILCSLAFHSVNANELFPPSDEPDTEYQHPYKVGDIGPSGGLVLSVSTFGNVGVEAAPYDMEKAGHNYGPNSWSELLTWQEATGYLSYYWTHNDHQDWRLPSINELITLHSLQKEGLETNMDEMWYWSSSEFSTTPDNVRHSYIYSFYSDEDMKDDPRKSSLPIIKTGWLAYARPVRSFTWEVDICKEFSKLSIADDEVKKDFIAGWPKEEKEKLQNSECAIKYSIGDTGPAGGWVFSLNEEGTHGLEAAPDDVRGRWGCHGVSLEGKALSRELGGGVENTKDLLATSCHGSIATEVANYVLNDYDDWYLPSHGELHLMYSNIHEIGNFKKTGGFRNTMYWTSTTNETYKNSLRFSYIRDFINGWSNLAEKTFYFRARPTRGF